MRPLLWVPREYNYSKVVYIFRNYILYHTLVVPTCTTVHSIQWSEKQKRGCVTHASFFSCPADHHRPHSFQLAGNLSLLLLTAAPFLDNTMRTLPPFSNNKEVIAKADQLFKGWSGGADIQMKVPIQCMLWAIKQMRSSLECHFSEIPSYTDVVACSAHPEASHHS